MENNLKTQGFVLLDVDVVALNNAGKSTTSNFDNAVATKTIFKNGKSYVYVSGQAWRYWWREALQKNLGWKLSPVIRDSKIAYTNANPIEFPDDDVFGYMRAASEEIVDDKGKKKNVNITVTRISPLKNSAIISAASVRPVENWSSMARQEGDSVPYAKQEYSAIMKGMFSLDLNMIGTFSNYNKTGYQNLSDKLKAEALENGAVEIDDNFVETKKLIQLPKPTRVSRAVDTISALKNISGGAMQTNNMGDVTPKFIVLATTNTGNHPFSHIAKSKGERDEVVVLNIDGLEEVLNEYKDNFKGKIFIGKRSGFFDDENESLKKLQEKFSNTVVLGTINEAIDQYCEQLKEQMQ
ncbi:type I-B CRISPR-associated protein Cas7/Cst2/DevR [Petrimonas sulfuriphila]|jgi:CRISPR-associated protein Cst2|uniref:type I-B CRISPR-associated protein Cas7/Cst2/DevR n=1 Tax=Petrimonas sulfuriphila TaxID=285070 RepID=UPI0032489CA5